MQPGKVVWIRTTHATASAFRMRSVRAFAYWTPSVKANFFQMQCIKAKVLRTTRATYLPSGRSASLPDAACQRKYHPDDVCNYICLPDEECQGICLLDPECQGKFLPDAACEGKGPTDDACHTICLLDAVRVFRTQGVKANVVRTMRVRASAFWTRSVRAFPFQMRSVRVFDY